MNFKVKLSKGFIKDIKPLSKRYRSLASDFEKLIDQLETNPTIGTPLGKDCYKIRLAIKSKNKGKSGGARVISYVVTDNKEVILLSIFDKSEKADLKPNELDQLMEDFE